MSTSPRNIRVYETQRSSAETPVEMCEHKGVGHPDTITDAVCEAVALELAKRYESKFGHGLHFNVDKGLLVGGRSEPRFAGGRVVDRPKLIVCGRATNPDDVLDLPALVTGAAAGWLDRTLSAGASLFEVSSEVRAGSANLQSVVAQGGARANDTSFGVGYAPLSTLERTVLRLADVLGSGSLRERVPAAGQDFKIMGLRCDAEMTFTVAIALVDRLIPNRLAYFETKDFIRSILADSLDGDERILINRLDDPDAGDERGLYLTVTGLSAEMGDDGQVGRGNRVNGLITPGRSMSMEAAAGKNPYAHVGKIYNVLAHRLARTLCAEIPEVKEVTVRLLSAIGQPIDAPQVAAVEILGPVRAAVREAVCALVDRELDAVGTLQTELAQGRLRVY